MDMNVTVPMTYAMFLILLLFAGIVGSLVRLFLVKDEKRKATRAGAWQDPEDIVVDSPYRRI